MKVPLFKRTSRLIRGRLRSKVLAGYGVGVLAATKNGNLIVDPGDFNVSRRLLTRGEYDWPEVTLLSRLVNDSSRIVFVGAHVGALLVPIVRAARTEAVVAYEPSPRNYRMLQMNLRLNEIGGITAHNVAVGAAPGTARFTENPINTGNSRVSLDGGEIEVAVATLDATLPPSWNTIDLMVMDVEGFEAYAMRGAPETLAKTQRLYVEFAPEQLREQGSTVDEFVDLAGRHFVSAYVINRTIQFLGPGRFTSYLKELPQRRGLLLNLLLTRDTQPDPRIVLES